MAVSIRCLAALAAVAVLPGPSAWAQEVTFKDPVGDDKGPGAYTYPTDAVYKPGSFDLTQLTVKQRGDKVDVEVSMNSALEDPWRMGTGFSVQMIFVFVDTKQGGFTKGLPGTNVAFAEGSAWDKVVILSPQAAARVRSEVTTKAAAMKDAIVIPDRVRGSGRKLSATVPKADLGDGDVGSWGYQVIVQSNEGFPAGTDLLTRKVNEYEGQHRFGGGTDGDCDPHAMDVLAGAGAGAADEAQAQFEMLKYECAPDGTATKPATLAMVRRK